MLRSAAPTKQTFSSKSTTHTLIMAKCYKNSAAGTNLLLSFAKNPSFKPLCRNTLYLKHQISPKAQDFVDIELGGIAPYAHAENETRLVCQGVRP